MTSSCQKTLRCRRRVDHPPAAVRWLCGCLAGLVVLLGALTASPAAHEELHCDADSPHHVCAVTLAAQGFCDTTPADPQVYAALSVGTTGELPPASFDWLVPSHWHAQALAPPARGS